jgi:diguanylate cyclase (GGDEF)-like protein
MPTELTASFLLHAPAIIGVFNRQLKLIEWNLALAELCSVKHGELAGKSLGELAPGFAAGIQPLLEQVLFAGEPIEAEITSEPARYPGVIRHWRAFAFPSGELEVGLMAFEITEQKHNEDALQSVNRRLEASLAETARSSLMIEMAHLLHAAKVTEEIYNIVARYAPRLFPGTSGSLCMLNSSKNMVEVAAAWGPAANSESLFTPDDCWALREGRPHHVDDPESGLICKHVNRERQNVELCVPMIAQYEALGVLHLSKRLTAFSREGFTEQEMRMAEVVGRGIALPIANVHMRELFREQALHDPLTGLYNRRYLQEALDREIRRASRKQATVGLIMIDVDHFKQLNDAHGHPAGDAILRAVSALLQARTRAEDVLCRYGGDEFSIVMPEASLEDAMKRAEELREGVRQISIEMNGRIVDGISISLGAAVFPEHGATLDMLVREADSALYAAKTSGRNRVRARLSSVPKRSRAEA